MTTLTQTVRPTTFIESRPLEKLFGTRITIATETFQHTGSFKFRAAYNTAANVPNDTIITASSGNFGQGLAYACLLLGKKCIVVMPETSARVKIEAVKSHGAIVDLIDTKKIGRAERVLEIARQYPAAYRASAYDDPLVIEGNASLGAEIANYRENFDIVIAPIGGGGLASGIIKGLCDNGNTAKVLGAEPLLGNDAARSLQAGKIIRNEQEPQTIADGARTVSLGEHNWRILQNGLAGIVEVSEEKIMEAVRMLFSHAHLKVEPTGALSLGAILEKPENFADKSICLVVSGGNVDAEVYRQILAS
ncbi:MAG TPA: pyridoxal-phosphate dependent enzyme [Pyrinomonadaceae bacterium]|nr:pyridoxal-phosphate dependent enzyme [Pyrinomonadaceae bacterium]